MSLKINYLKKTNLNSNHLVLFTNDNFKINGLKKYLSDSEFSYISELLKSSDLKKNILLFDLNSKKKIILVSIKNNLKNSDIENLGAEFFGKINYGKKNEFIVISDSIESKNKKFLGYFLHGLKLKSYEFGKYKTKKETRNISLNVSGFKNTPNSLDKLKFRALEEGTFYARDLVSEPGNILHPDEYAKRLNSLRKDGLKINIYDKKTKKTRHACFTWRWTRKCQRFLPCYYGVERYKKKIRSL